MNDMSISRRNLLGGASAFLTLGGGLQVAFGADVPVALRNRQRRRHRNPRRGRRPHPGGYLLPFRPGRPAACGAIGRS